MRVAHIIVCHSVDPSKVFESIPHNDDAAWFVFFHGWDLELLGKVEVSVRRRGGHLFPYMVNRGLAKSWNAGIHLAVQAQCEAIMLLNDDLFFTKARIANSCERSKASKI
jgi:GT2 family glycosyltransferase